jgi:hypothetical protein
MWCACSESPDRTPVRDAGERGDAGASGDAEQPFDAAADAEREDAARLEDAAAPPDSGPPPACEVVAPTVCPDPMPRYDDVSPIFAARCTSCHNGSDGMWPLSTYQHVADWYGEIRAQMLACTMPPPDSGQTMPLEERLELLDWIRCGFPR